MLLAVVGTSRLTIPLCLSRRYGPKTQAKVAVKGVSLGIKRGECLGYLGINGAGKTS